MAVLVVDIAHVSNDNSNWTSMTNTEAYARTHFPASSATFRFPLPESSRRPSKQTSENNTSREGDGATFT